ncbi:hypothetical protein D3C79_918020 [compost metagenome]
MKRLEANLSLRCVAPRIQQPKLFAAHKYLITNRGQCFYEHNRIGLFVIRGRQAQLPHACANGKPDISVGELIGHKQLRNQVF